MRRIADTACELGTAMVRVFSFFIPAGQPPRRHRSQVIDRMAALAGIAEDRGLVLAHENEKGIYGDTPARCADLITPSARRHCGRPSTRRISSSAVSGPSPKPTARSGPTWPTSRSRTRSRPRARSCPRARAARALKALLGQLSITWR